MLRDAMLNPKAQPYDVAVFVGGMEGIFDEALRFRTLYFGKPKILLRLTGGASRMVVEELGNLRAFVPPPRPPRAAFVIGRLLDRPRRQNLS